MGPPLPHESTNLSRAEKAALWAASQRLGVDGRTPNSVREGMPVAKREAEEVNIYIYVYIYIYIYIYICIYIYIYIYVCIYIYIYIYIQM